MSMPKSFILSCCLCLVCVPAPTVRAEDATIICDVRTLEEQFRDVVDLLDRDCPETNRSAAAQRLRESNPYDPVFWRLVNDRNATVRECAISAVAAKAHRDKKSCPMEVIRALLDDDRGVRLTAGTYFGAFERLPDEASPVLLKALRHDDQYTRRSAAASFHHLGKPAERGLPELTRAMDDADPFVRHNAAVSIWHITHRADLVLRTNLDILAIETPREKAGEFTPSFVSAFFIRKIGLEAPRDTGSALLKCLADPDPKIRRKAARCLSALAQEDDKTRVILRELKAEDALVDLLDDPDDAVRGEAALALDRLRKQGK